MGDVRGSAASGWFAPAEATDSTAPPRRLSMIPLGNLGRMGYDLATRASASAEPTIGHKTRVVIQARTRPCRIALRILGDSGLDLMQRRGGPRSR